MTRKTAIVFFVMALVFSTAIAEAGNIPRRAYAYKRLLIRSAHASPLGFEAPIAVLAAQVHAESLWKSSARSWCGAEGLAQFMPKTATWISDLLNMGEAKPQNPGWALRAMCEYDYMLLRGVSNSYSICDQWAFALSGYNGGAGWRKRDQRLAVKQGYDPTRWWGHVEKVNAGRSESAWEENRGYPKKILLRFAKMYENAGWGRSIICGGLQ